VRTSHGRPVIVTTNYKGEELENKSRSATTEFTVVAFVASAMSSRWNEERSA
jgi:hypothetical protein